MCVCERESGGKPGLAIFPNQQIFASKYMRKVLTRGGAYLPKERFFWRKRWGSFKSTMRAECYLSAKKLPLRLQPYRGALVSPEKDTEVSYRSKKEGGAVFFSQIEKKLGKKFMQKPKPKSNQAADITHTTHTHVKKDDAIFRPIIHYTNFSPLHRLLFFFFLRKVVLNKE